MFSDSNIVLTSTNIKTLKSDISIDLSYKFSSFNDFQDFNHKVYSNYKIKPSLVYGADISYFTSTLKGFEEVIKVSGLVEGYTNNLNADNLLLKWNDNTVVSTSFAFRDLVEDTRVLKFNIHSINSTFNELNSFPMYPFSSKETLPLSFVDFKRVDKRVINVKGDLTIKSGEVDMLLYFNQGEKLISELELKIKNNKVTIVDGEIKAINFPLYYIKDIPKNIFNNVSSNINFHTEVSSFSDIEIYVKGAISSIDIYNNKFSNITLDGKLKGSSFDGIVHSKDSLLLFDYKGLLDFNDEKPIYNLSLNLDRFKIQDLKLPEALRIPLLDLSFKSNFITEKNSEHLVTDSFDFDSLNLQLRDSSSIYVGKVNFKNQYDKNDNSSSLALSSDMINAKIKGEFDFNSITKSFQKYEQIILKDKTYKAYSDSSLVFEYELNVIKGREINKISENQITISDSSYLKGYVDGLNDKEEIILISDSIGFGKLLIDSVDFHLVKNKSNLDFMFYANSLLLNKNENLAPFKKINIDADFNPKEARFYLDWYNGANYNGKINLNADISNYSKYSVRLDSSEINLGAYNWVVDPESVFSFEDNNLFFERVSISTRENQEIRFNGSFYSKQSKYKDTLLMSFNNINLSQFDNLLSNTTKLEGYFTGELITDNLFFPKQSSIYSIKAELDSLSLNTRNVGEVDLLAFWDSNQELFSVSGSAEHNLFNSVLYYGTIDIYDDINQLNIKSTLKEFDISIIDPYLSDELFLHKANLKGDIHITGTMASPILNGDLIIEQGVIEIAKFKVPYKFSGGLSFSQNKIYWNKLTLIDDDDNIAYCSGTLSHNGFENFNLDLNINSEYLKLFNNTQKDFNYFYGLGYINADVNLKTLGESFLLSGDIKTLKNSKITIPIDYVDEVAKANFITFIDEDSELNKEVPIQKT